MSGPLKVAVAGLGTVGAETVRLLEERGDLIGERAGRRIEVVGVSARDRSRDRGIDTGKYQWCDNAADLADMADADLIVEAIGGSEGIAKDLVERAIGNGKHVVTANKALLAHHGASLGKMAEGAGVHLAYEAAVAGGIPIIKSLREGLAANSFSRIYGILNGTCNYILSTMRETGAKFADVLADAQELGYAEADPAFDIDGVDAAHKLSIMASIAFGREVDFDAVHIEGIRHVSPTDIEFADELGYRIKLLGICEEGAGGVVQRVHPCMVPVAAPISQVEGVFNAVVAEGDAVGTTLHYGRGAGAGPTASAVIADIIDIAAGRSAPTFGLPQRDIKPAVKADFDQLESSYYIRLEVVDKPGVLADITAIFRDEAVSVEAMLQRSRDPHEAVPVVLTTHETTESAMRRSLQKIQAMETVTEEPRMIRIVAL